MCSSSDSRIFLGGSLCSLWGLPVVIIGIWRECGEEDCIGRSSQVTSIGGNLSSDFRRMMGVDDIGIRGGGR